MSKNNNSKKDSCCKSSTSNATFVVGLLSVLTIVFGISGNVDHPTPAASKPFDSFEEFYPFYLSQHSDLTCRRLHLIGTSIILLIALVQPFIFSGLILSGLTGLALFPLFRGIETGLVEMIAMFLVFILTVKKFSGKMWKGVAILLIAYGFAWVGHFVYENNKPATFVYPLYSLMGDFKMWWSVVSGERPF